MFWKGALSGIALGVVVTIASVGAAWVYIVVTTPVQSATGE